MTAWPKGSARTAPGSARLAPALQAAVRATLPACVNVSLAGLPAPVVRQH